MRWVDKLRLRLRSLLHSTRVERELEYEFESHLEALTAENIEAGMTPQTAREAALLVIGEMTQQMEECRDMRRVNWIDNSVQDLKYTLRTLVRNPGFATAAILSLALGIGASTAVFSVVNTILLRPLPYPDASRIVIPWKLAAKYANFGSDVYPWSPGEFRVLRNVSAFEYLGLFKADTLNLTGRGDPESLKGLLVSYGFFPALGISPAKGRFFTAEEDQPGHDNVVMLSDRLWRNKFQADPAILGRTIDINGTPRVVIGVMPGSFAFPRAEEMPKFFNLPREIQLWIPLAVPPARLKPEPSELSPVARLRAGLSVEQAQAQLDTEFTAVMDRTFPAGKGHFQTRVTPLAQQLTADARLPLLLILGAVVVVLSIASSNVANLLLARSLGRKREFTLRAALGAGSGRLIRQLLTESLLLAVAAGIAGISLSFAGIALLKYFGPTSITRLQDVAMDARVFLFAFGLSVITGILFGLAPALGAARIDLGESLKESGARAGGSSARSRLRNLLVVSEVALALVLVVAAGLLTRTFIELMRTDPGFRPAHVLTFELTLPAAKYPDQASMARLYLNVVDRLRMEPGVLSAGLGQVVPMGGSADATVFRIEGRPLPADPEHRPYTSYTLATSGYFSALGIPMLSGRDLSAADTADSQRVVVINQSMARKYFPGEDPIGKLVSFGGGNFGPMMIVGVVGDVKQESLREDPVPHMYAPVTQKTWTPMGTMQIAVRTVGDPAGATGYARDAVHAADPQLPLANVSTLSNLVEESMTQPRFAMLLLAGFGVLALVLASVGIYGVVSYSVAQRTTEIGIRIAIGARRADVFRMVLAQGGKLAGIGIVSGLIAALLLTRLMKSFLYGVTPVDPATFIGVSIVLATIALVACFVPARRAMLVDPIVALRCE